MKSVVAYGAILVVSMGAAWMQYISDEAPPKEGVVLLDGKKEELERIHYKSPELDVTYETRQDDGGAYGWVTVIETKKKKKDGVDVVEPKTTRFKAGTAADKVLDAMAPMMAMRPLEGLDDAKIESFGLKEPDTKVEVTVRGKTLTLDLGGETYGSKDRYVRDVATGRVYVVDDEVFKPLKFANSRLPERALTSPKTEELETITVGQGGTTVEWKQKNRDDKAQAYWERQQPPTAADAVAKAGEKDETFGNWAEKILKVKSTGYVQEGDEPVEPRILFDLSVAATGKKPETVTFYEKDGSYYAKSTHTRGMVKLSKPSIEDLQDEVDDILAGKIPPEKPKPAKPAVSERPPSPHGGPMMTPPGPPGRPMPPTLPKPN